MISHTDKDTVDGPSLDEARPGHELRCARERAGISREHMAERLRLAPQQFDALEHDDYGELPPPAFVRGYIRAYARELGLEPEEFVAAYNRSGVSGKDPEIRSGGVTDTSSSSRGGLIGLILIALVAAAGIGAWWYQQEMLDGAGESGAADTVEEERASAGAAEDADGRNGDGAQGLRESDAADDMGGGSDGAASGNGEADDETATESDAAADDTDTNASDGAATVDAEAAGAIVTAANGTGEEAAADSGDADETADDDRAADGDAEQSRAAEPSVESRDTGDDGARDVDTVAETSVAGTGGNAGDGTEDAAAESDDGADGDTPEDTGSADEPGASSPAATDSPTNAATEAADEGPDQLMLEFTGRSWLEVYDDRQRELVYTLYFGSEPITLQGWAPFEIFLGNSPAVEVRINGEVVDKSAFTQGNNTARFLVDGSGVRAP